jgi:GT2 family glycosyltransferase
LALASRDGPGAPLVVAVVLNWNGLAETRDCLASLRSQSYSALRMLVVDNGSEHDPSGPIAREFPDVPVLRLPENRGYTGGSNAGLRQALAWGARYVLLLNNDLVAEPRLVERLVAAAEADPGLGMLGALGWLGPERALPERLALGFRTGGRAGFWVEQPLDRVMASGAVVPADLLNGCCLFLRAELVARVGWLDERLFLCHEDTDLCFRVRRAGLRLGLVAEPLYHHVGGVSFRRGGHHPRDYYEIRNLLLVIRKHLKGTARLAGLWTWLCYAHYRFDSRSADGNLAACRATAQGMADALGGRSGHYPGPSRAAQLAYWLLRLLGWLTRR